MSEKDDVFKTALQGKKIPILTLDHKWHKLFTQTGETQRIKGLEEDLNALLKRQGKLNTESREIHALKTKLMDTIVNSMQASDVGDKMAVKRMDETKRLIEDCNQKLDAYRDELLELPNKIAETNYELMLETMELCYTKIQENTSEINDIKAWISEIRGILKEKVLKKQEKEMWNQLLYKYMHETFGAEVIDIFDLKYHMGTSHKGQEAVIPEKAESNPPKETPAIEQQSVVAQSEIEPTIEES